MIPSGWSGLVARLRDHQVLRFLVVGAFNTGLCYLVYALLILLAGLPFWAANLGALIFGLCWSYLTLGRLVFGNRGAGRFGRFILGWVVVYAVQTSAVGLLMRAGIAPTLGGLIVLPGVAVASFLIQKRLVFRRPASGPA